MKTHHFIKIPEIPNTPEVLEASEVLRVMRTLVQSTRNKSNDDSSAFIALFDSEEQGIEEEKIFISLEESDQFVNDIDFYVPGIYPKINHGIHYWMLLAEKGSVIAQYHIGITHYRRESYSESLRWINKATRMLTARSQYLLGMMYHSGYGVPKDDILGLLLVNSSLDKGYRSAIDLIHLISRQLPFESRLKADLLLKEWLY